MKPFNCFTTPIFILSYNRLTYLKQLVAMLQSCGYSNIHIIDNNSTYPQLLDFYKEKSGEVTIHYMEKNYGHLALWECHQFDKLLKESYYVYTDSDILPDENCPKDFLAYFYEQLCLYPKKSKVGFSLKIDDLPEYFADKPRVQKWENQFWQKKMPDGINYDARIDTTFALYKPHVNFKKTKWWFSIRTAAPYTARHMPWYENSEQKTNEIVYYEKSINMVDSFWTEQSREKMIQSYIQLKVELDSLKQNNYIIPKHFIYKAIKKIANKLFPSLYENFKKLVFHFFPKNS